MKKLIPIFAALALVIIICATLLPTESQAATVASGICGDNLTWVLDDTGTLTISGTGKMTDYTFSNEAPWGTKILMITITKGVTSIGDFAFSSCTSLTSINIPDSITSIGDYAFAWCTKLTDVEIPEGVASIGQRAFAYNYSLASIMIPEGVTSVGMAAFTNCIGLTSITIPDSVTSIGNYAFASCTNLWHILYQGSEQSWETIEINASKSDPLFIATLHYNCSGNEITDLANKQCSICQSADSPVSPTESTTDLTEAPTESATPTTAPSEPAGQLTEPESEPSTTVNSEGDALPSIAIIMASVVMTMGAVVCVTLRKKKR